MSISSKLIIFVAILASLLEIIDTTIVNVALPTIMGNLGVTLDEASMIITAYAVANAIVLPASAWLSERFGRRKYYLGCISIFTLSSLACSVSPNLTSLIIFRIFQGLAGGALLPISQTLVSEQFPKEKWGIGSAIFGMSILAGPTLGPILGGYLTDNYGWRAIFDINLPIGLVALLIGLIYIQDEMGTEKLKTELDIVGILLLISGVGCLQFLLERGQSNDWFSSKIITVCAIVSFVSLIIFIFWELKVKSPIINLRLFKQPIVVSGVILMGCLGFYLYGFVFILPVFENTTFHYTAMQIGKLFIPGTLLLAILMPFVGKLNQTLTDSRLLIIIGLITAELCLYMMTLFSVSTSEHEILYVLFIRGVSLAFLFIPINVTILRNFSNFEVPQIAGLLNLFRQLGGSISIALINTLLPMFTTYNYNNLRAHVSNLNANSLNSLNSAMTGFSFSFTKGIGLSNSSNAALLNLYHRAQSQVFILSFLQIIKVMMVIFLISFIPVVFTKLKKK